MDKKQGTLLGRRYGARDASINVAHEYISSITDSGMHDKTNESK